MEVYHWVGKCDILSRLSYIKWGGAQDPIDKGQGHAHARECIVHIGLCVYFN